MALLEIQADPISHFMPTKTTPQGSFFCAAPPSMTHAPELAAMFMFPVRDPKEVRRRADADDANPRSPKKAKLANGAVMNVHDENMDESVQIGRRGAGSEHLFDVSGMDQYAGGGADFTFDAGDGGMGMDLDALDINLDIPAGDDAIRRQKHRAVSRLVDDTRSTPGFDDQDHIGMDTYDAQSCTIGMFDMRSTKDSAQTQTQAEREAMREEAEDIDQSTERVQSKGYSKNTLKAIAVIRKGLENEEDADDQFLSFTKVAQKASRRAASAFFFELLVLSTRDCVRITQNESFGNIEIRAKEKLWESLPATPPTTA
jgi:cohesin complex subunit SCC1